MSTVLNLIKRVVSGNPLTPLERDEFQIVMQRVRHSKEHAYEEAIRVSHPSARLSLALSLSVHSGNPADRAGDELEGRPGSDDGCIGQ